jgi:hypothetical protein
MPGSGLFFRKEKEVVEMMTSWKMERPRSWNRGRRLPKESKEREGIVAVPLALVHAAPINVNDEERA